MSTSTTYTCNCGCGVSVTDPHDCGWFVLSQLPYDPNGDGPKLRGTPLYFATLFCLKKWTASAIHVLPGLQRTSRTLSPRGETYNPDLPDLAV